MRPALVIGGKAVGYEALDFKTGGPLGPSVELSVKMSHASRLAFEWSTFSERSGKVVEPVDGTLFVKGDRIQMEHGVLVRSPLSISPAVGSGEYGWIFEVCSGVGGALYEVTTRSGETRMVDEDGLTAMKDTDIDKLRQTHQEVRITYEE